MSRAETLLKIKEAEAKAKEIITEAEEKQNAIATSARRDAVRMVQDADDRMKAEYDSAFAQEKARIATQREGLLRKGREEAERLKSKAAGNVPKAKAQLKDRFERTIDASS